MDYDTAAIRRFLVKHFSDTDLRALCLDYFRDVYEDFTTGMGKRQMVQNLIEHCLNYGRLPDLMAAVQRERPQLYTQHFPHPSESIPERPAQAYAPPQRNPRQVFISHAHQDANFAQRLAADLEARGYAAWIAPDSIRPGEKWGEAIERGLQESGIFVVALTPRGVASQWVRTETYLAIELEHKGLVHFMPLRVETSEVPLLWQRYQSVPFQDSYKQGLQQLLRRLGSGDSATVEATAKPAKEAPKARLQQEREMPGPPVEVTPDVFVHPKTGKEMVRIPAGEFLYGENKEKVTLDEYWIDKTPVTNAEYKRFLDANPDYQVPYVDENWARPYNWDQRQRTYPADKAGHPVVLVSWHSAKAYADWAGLRLPTEQEWEKAARGADGREYPWGNEWRDNCCNTIETGIRATTPVGRFSPQGDSPYGCVDMAGNVWEWTDLLYDKAKDWRVVRGGSWYDARYNARAAARADYHPYYRNLNLGFRVVRRPPSPGR